jgi:hypothetical protein
VVAQLFVENNGGWNFPLLHELFDWESREAIKRILVSQNSNSSRWAWTLKRK